MGRKLAIAAALLTVLATTPARPAAFVATSPGLDNLNHRILSAHNAARADVGAPPLQWDPALAVAAASYGPALSRMGRLVHSPRAGRENQRENLWMGQQGRFQPEHMVAAWTDEKRLFFPGAIPERQPHGELVRRRALHADDLEGHDARRLRPLSGRHLGLSDLPLFAARQSRR